VGSVTSNESWRRLLDAGAAVGQATLARANDIAKGLMAGEPAVREQARRDLDELGRAGRRLGEQVAETLRSGLVAQVAREARLDALVDLFEDLMARPARHGADPGTRPPDAAPGLGAGAEGHPSDKEPKKSKGSPSKKKAKAKHKQAGPGRSAKERSLDAQGHEHRASGPTAERL
jgi:hypothetical protein